MKNETEAFWAGDFGRDYTERNAVTVEHAFGFFERVICNSRIKTSKIERVLELGANKGHNLKALKRQMSWIRTTAVEINGHAIDAMIKAGNADEIIANSLLDLPPPALTYDLVLTKGVLIHIPPASLTRAYQVIHQHASRYILLAEYYSPVVQMIPYRGEVDRLWKAPHAEHMLGAYPDLHLLDYGFVSRLDQTCPQDDLTWWLLEKK